MSCRASPYSFGSTSPPPVRTRPSTRARICSGASPPTNTLEWSDESVEGSYRFLKRVWAYALRQSQAEKTQDPAKEVRFEIHSVLKQASYDLQKHQFNTVASAAMKILNALEKIPGRSAVTEEGLSILLRLLSPITPHIASATRETRQAMGDLCKANLDKWFAERAVLTLIPEL